MGNLPGIVITVFLHSIWQGLTLAVLAWLSLRFTRNWSAGTRYNILVFFLLSFAGCVAATFLFQEGTQPSFIGPALTADAAALTGVVESSSVLQAIFRWCNANSNWIFIVWCTIFLVKAAQMVRGLMAVDRLRQFGTLETDAQWSHRFTELKTLLGISKKVALSESCLITQPMVIGVFKPMVLIPVGLVTGLHPKEVEAVLLHELAHIKRNDFLVNLLQSFLETVFFFNPFFYWLSSMVRNEREHCCDALAMQHIGSKKTFLQALLSIHELKPSPAYAMTLLGHKSLLAARVDRIISEKKKNISAMEKITLTTSYVLLFAALLSFSIAGSKKYVAVKHLPVINHLFREKTEPEMVADVTESPVNADTIPKNRSKEFMEGYKAGLNYKNKTAHADNTKKQIEEELSKQDRTVTTTVIQPGFSTTITSKADAREKKRIEEALVAQKKDN